MKLKRIENQIYGSIVTVQYLTKCTDPRYQKFTIKPDFIHFAANMTWSLLTSKFSFWRSNPHLCEGTSSFDNCMGISVFFQISVRTGEDSLDR